MSKTLLLADDSSTIQRVVELTFATEDIRVVAVTDGEQAVKSIEHDHPDIVLADVGMPRMDGYSVSSHVKTSPDLQHIPVLLLAGAFEPVDEERARTAQADGVMIKPFEPRALVNRVQELLNAPRATKVVAAPVAEAPAYTNGAVVHDPGPAVPSWYKPEVAATERPAVPALDTADLDGKLAAFVPELEGKAEAEPLVVSDSLMTASPVPEPLVLDLGSFTPVHGVNAVPLSWNEPRGPEPLELAPMPVAVVEPPAPSPEPAGPPAAAPAAPAVADAPAPVTGGGKVSLATAFSALLAAEQAQPSGAPLAAGLDQQMLEEVVRRVLLNDDSVRRMVLDATERIVKEEIERIQSAPDAAEEAGPETQ